MLSHLGHSMSECSWYIFDSSLYNNSNGIVGIEIILYAGKQMLIVTN